jgi:DNA-binding transcriptional MerR regulator
MDADDGRSLTIDELARAAGTTTRRIRSFQTMGLLPGPELQGRTGWYGPSHRDRLAAILRLQQQGFSLESVQVLFQALARGESLSDLVGLVATTAPAFPGDADAATDTSELYGFPELQPSGHPRPLLSLVPTTLWADSEAS